MHSPYHTVQSGQPKAVGSASGVGACSEESPTCKARTQPDRTKRGLLRSKQRIKAKRRVKKPVRNRYLHARRKIKSQDTVQELAYLRFCRRSVIVAIGGCTKRGTRTVFTRSQAAALGEILLTLRLADLDLLLLATASKLLGLERVLRLELRSAVFWDVSLGHGGWASCGLRVQRSTGGESQKGRNKTKDERGRSFRSE